CRGPEHPMKAANSVGLSAPSGFFKETQIIKSIDEMFRSELSWAPIVIGMDDIDSPELLLEIGSRPELPCGIERLVSRSVADAGCLNQAHVRNCWIKKEIAEAGVEHIIEIIFPLGELLDRIRRKIPTAGLALAGLANIETDRDHSSAVEVRHNPT